MFQLWNITASMCKGFIEKLFISLVFLLFIINSSLSFSQHILDGINNSPQLIQNYSYNLENQLIGYDLTGYSSVTAPDFSFVAEYNGTDGIDGLGRLVLAEEDVGQVGGGSAAYLWSHTYDERSQLTATVRIKDLSGYWNQTFTYDLNGNLLKQQEYSQSAQTFSHSGDVLTQVDAQALDSDDNGQMQETLSATDVDWNWEGKIRSVTRPDGTTISYKYDDVGNRIYKKVDDGQSTEETRFLWMTPGDLPVLLAEINAATDNVIRSYIHANTQPVVLFDGDMTDSLTDKYFYLSDRLGSVRLIVDESVGVSHHYAYKPFGQTDSAESDSGQAAPYNPLMFTGQYYDVDTELYHLRARDYDPNLFIFTAFDPVRGLREHPLMLHRYLYTANSPINYTDPSGLYIGFDDAAFALAGAVVGLASQIIADYIAGERSDLATYTGSVLGGALGGWSTLYAGGIVGGAVGGGTSELITEALHSLEEHGNIWEGLDSQALMGSTLMGATLGAAGAPRVSGVTVGRGSMGQVTKMIVTKAKRGLIKQVTSSTFAKIVMYNTVQWSYAAGLFGFYSGLVDYSEGE